MELHCFVKAPPADPPVSAWFQISDKSETSIRKNYQHNGSSSLSAGWLLVDWIIVDWLID